MSETLQYLQTLGRRGDRGFYGCPLPYEGLDEVEMLDGSRRKALRPNVPVNFNPKSGLYEPHSGFPVVCVAKDFPVSALHRALCHPAIHSDLPQCLRRHGIDAQTGMPTTTVELLEKIKTTAFVSYVHVVKFVSPPFIKFEEEVDEWRSPVPIEVLETHTVNGADLVYAVELK